MLKYLAIAGFALGALMSGISDQAIADQHTSIPKPPHSAGDDFVFVPSDAVLKQVGQTREQWNKADPKAERAWREAWAANGKAQDTAYFAGIRQNSAPPKPAAANGGG